MAQQDDKKHGEPARNTASMPVRTSAEAARVVASSPNVNWSAAERLFRLSEPVKAHIHASARVQK